MMKPTVPLAVLASLPAAEVAAPLPAGAELSDEAFVLLAQPATKAAAQIPARATAQTR
jgi:hypothetical protein